MASSSHYSQFLRLLCCFIFLTLFFLPWSCTATRSGGTIIMDSIHTNLKQGVRRHKGLQFNFFPKGGVPPSGPSHRHNDVENSIHN
ncbi:hypothetical protein ACHQM5_006913 [Ranunculus cassubicifolius]